jgi:hypothetical protein
VAGFPAGWLRGLPRHAQAAEAISTHIPNPRSGGSFPKPDSGHASTIRLTIRVRQRIWNAMKPGFHGVQTP